MSRTVSGAKGKRLRLGSLKASEDDGLRVRCIVSGAGLSPVTSEEALLFAGDGWYPGVQPISGTLGGSKFTSVASAGNVTIGLRDGMMFRTTDGKNWQERLVLPADASFRPLSIAGKTGKGFVAVSESGLAISEDGLTWTVPPLGPEMPLAAARSVAYDTHFLVCGQKHVVSGTTATTEWRAFTSANGLSWNPAAVPNSTLDPTTPPAFFDCGQQVVCLRPAGARIGVPGSGTLNKVYRSTQFAGAWLEATTPVTPDGGWKCAVKFGSTYFVFGWGDKYAYSSDLITWSVGDMPFFDTFSRAAVWQGNALSPGGLLVVTGNKRTAAVCVNPTTREWRAETMTCDDVQALTAGSRFIAIADDAASLRDYVANPVPPPPPPETRTPSAVLDLTATGRSLAIDLDWGEPSSSGGSEITSYTIQHRLAGGQWSAATSVSDAQTSTSIAVAAAGNYEVRVAAVNANGTGPFSTVTETVTAAPPAGAPTGLGAVGDPSGGYNYGGRAFRKVLLSWSAPSGTAPASYKVQFQYGTAGIWNDLPFGWGGRNNATLAMTGTTSAAFTFVTTINSATASGIRPPLKFRVGSVSAGGAVTWGDPISFSTLKTASPPSTSPPSPPPPNPVGPPAPTGVVAAYLNTVGKLPAHAWYVWARYSISWTPPEGATSYALQAYAAATKRWVNAGAGDPSKAGEEVGRLNLVMTSATEGLLYWLLRIDTPKSVTNSDLYRRAQALVPMASAPAPRTLKFRLVPYAGKTPGTPSAEFTLSLP